MVRELKSTLRCLKCKEDLPRDDFELNSKGNRRQHCIPCRDETLNRPASFSESYIPIEDIVPAQSSRLEFKQCRRCWAVKNSAQFKSQYCDTCVERYS